MERVKNYLDHHSKNDYDLARGRVSARKQLQAQLATEHARESNNSGAQQHKAGRLGGGKLQVLRFNLVVIAETV